MKSLFKSTAGALFAMLAFGIFTPAGAVPLNIGISGYGSANAMAGFLNSNGHNATYFGSSAPNAAQLAGLDAILLVRTTGNDDVENFVLGGGLLVTEWSSSNWALNTANLLDATDMGGGFIATAVPITFTAAGMSAGLGNGLSNPHAAGGATDFFRSFSGIGSGVEILGIRPGNTAAIIGGASGQGSALIMGYDWQDCYCYSGLANTASEQLLLNAVQYRAAQSVPEPGSLALLGLGLVGMGFARRKAKA